MKDNPEKIVTAYRAVPTSVKETKLRNGDWVTLTEDYAREHGWRNLDDDYRIIKEDVPAKYLFTNGDNIHEFGYDNGSLEAYQNTENNAKSIDSITYDDDGNVIPLSQRFDKNNPDKRYSRKDVTDDTATEDSENISQLFTNTMHKEHYKDNCR